MKQNKKIDIQIQSDLKLFGFEPKTRNGQLGFYTPTRERYVECLKTNYKEISRVPIGTRLAAQELVMTDNGYRDTVKEFKERFPCSTVTINLPS